MTESSTKRAQEVERRTSLLKELGTLMMVEGICMVTAFFVFIWAFIMANDRWLVLKILAVIAIVVLIGSLIVACVGQWHSIDYDPTFETADSIAQANKARSALLMASRITLFTALVLDCVVLIWSIVL